MNAAELTNEVGQAYGQDFVEAVTGSRADRGRIVLVVRQLPVRTGTNRALGESEAQS